MKKCMRCTKPATLHITEIQLGQAQVVHLCETCAQKYLSSVEVGGIPSPEMDDDDEDEELDSEVEAEDAALAATEGEDEASTAACTGCGITFKQFRSVGRLGCPQCYTSFHDDLLSLLESIHQDTQHVGKCPPQTSANTLRHHELMRLRSELKAAVEQENYEEAARIRDQIQTTESQTPVAEDAAG
jgi:protein arginine kinase activator